MPKATQLLLSRARISSPDSKFQALCHHPVVDSQAICLPVLGLQSKTSEREALGLLRLGWSCHWICRHHLGPQGLPWVSSAGFYPPNSFLHSAKLPGNDLVPLSPSSILPIPHPHLFTLGHNVPSEPSHWDSSPHILRTFPPHIQVVGPRSCSLKAAGVIGSISQVQTSGLVKGALGSELPHSSPASIFMEGPRSLWQFRDNPRGRSFAAVWNVRLIPG